MATVCRSLPDSGRPRHGRHRAPSFWGLDLLRLAAMALVAVQHLLSVHGLEPPGLVAGLDPGAVGVALFCALSGWLAAKRRQEVAGQWLLRRLVRVYVPLWVSLTGIFAANAVLDYKPV